MNKKTQKSLAHAVEQLLPADMYQRILQSASPAPERTVDMTQENNVIKPFRQPKKWVALALAACLILAFGVFGAVQYGRYFAVDSIVDIDINPSIELSTNRAGKVLRATAVNADADAILDGMDLKNVDLKVALNAIIGSMLQNGYLTDGDAGILISVQNDDAARAARIRNLVLTDLNDSLKSRGLTASVLNQTVTASADANTFADTHQISRGKAAFVLNLCAKDATLDPALLASMSLREIAARVAEKNLDIHDIVDYDADDSLWENIADAVEDGNELAAAGTAGVTLTPADAKAVALAHAGVSADDAAFIKVELDREAGAMVYEVDFTAGGVEYDYEINAASGQVLRAEKELDDDWPAQAPGAAAPAAAAGRIIADEARAIAFAHAGVTPGWSAAELDDGIYEVNFTVDGIEYDYDIDAAGGQILRSNTEPDGDRLPGGGAGGSATVSYISADDARAIALADAGVSSSRASAELDDGAYEVSFTVDGIEYDYEIDAVSGEILHHSAERDD